MNNLIFTDLLRSYGNVLAILILVLEFLYIIFAFLITRQVKLLNHSFNTPYEKTFKSIAWIHLLASIGVFALSILLF